MSRVFLIFFNKKQLTNNKIDDIISFVTAEGYRSGHNEAVLKTVCPKGRVGSNPTLSAIFFFGNNLISTQITAAISWSSTQVGRRGAPAKGVGRETGARVQISPTPPKRKSCSLERLFLFNFYERFELVIGVLPKRRRANKAKLCASISPTPPSKKHIRKGYAFLF